MATTITTLLKELRDRIAGDILANDIIDEIEKEIPFIEIDGNADSETLRHAPRDAFVTFTPLPTVTVKYRGVTYSFKSPIVVDLKSEV